VSSAPDVIEIPDGDSNGNGNGSAQALTQAERDQAEIDSLRPHWTSPVYSFFDSKVTVGYEDNRKYHIFKCAAHRCKGKGIVRRYLDKGDKSSTSNLRTHAVRCFGEDAVAAATKGASHSRPDGSIHAAFGRQGSQPISVTHRAHTNPQIRANLVRWVTESNRSLSIIEDRKFRELMLAGRPQAEIPTCRTIARDIQASFNRCEERINRLLQEYPGHLNFATDAWTSPNHRAMAAWTVHLQHEGTPLVFLLDIFEIPEVILYFYIRRNELTLL
ncbi:hypothetical protein BT96DRAFT_1045372, partial [Gymnopus androsaceus JB14]